jgi:isopentenyl-diphosphate Delta-isomerase
MTEMVPAWVDGVLTPVEKLAVHQRGLRHMAVSVFVLDGSKILLQRRAEGKYHTPGLWTNTCCTHPRWGEDPRQCATRRLHEEMGITGLAMQSAGQIEYRADVGNDLIEHELVDVFVATAPAHLSMALNPAEVMAAKWIERADLAKQIAQNPDHFTPWLCIYLEAGIDTMIPA